MPFEVTATRKRPQTFEQLAGQNFVAATLISSLEQGRIAHAYLFSGPRGCGKTSTARILAKALNCERGPTATPCGTCASCTSISSGTSLDVIEIDGASNTSVDNIRQIKEEVLFAPNTGRYKIYIIDEVHMLSMSAFNALLKTIEEPPPYIVFIFATTEPQKVPATIKSRCQQFSFRLVPIDIIRQLLKQVALESDIDAEEEALLWISREAAGSVRDAYTLFDQIVSFSGKKITSRIIRETLGLVGIDQLNALLSAAIKRETNEAFSILDQIFERGVSPEQFLIDASDYFRSVLLIMNGVQNESLLSVPRNSFDPFVMQSLSKAQVEYILALLFETFRHLKETMDPRYELELAISKLSHIQSYISPFELFEAIKSMQKALQSPQITVNASTRSEVPLLHQQQEQKPTSSQPSSPQELRKKIIAKLRAQNLFLASALEKTQEWVPKHNGYIISATNRVELDLISRFSALVAETATQILGTSIAIEVQPAKALDRKNPNPSPQKHIDVDPISSQKQNSTEGSDEFDANDLENNTPSENNSLIDEIPPEEAETIEAIRKMFKGKIIATTRQAPESIPHTEQTLPEQSTTIEPTESYDEEDYD